MTMPASIAAADKEVQRHYAKMIRAGQSQAFAEMCSLGQPPGTKGSDRAFQEGRLDGNWLDKLPPRQAKRMVREAKKVGIDISGKQYISGLADKRGHMDPMAWVSDTSDVRRAAKAKNLTVQGIVNQEAAELPPRPSVGLNPKIVAELAKKELAKNPSLTKRQAENMAMEKHTPRWKKPK